jgi:hypothetical protein
MPHHLEFKKYPYKEASWNQLTELQQWGAKQLGWTSSTWNSDWYTPGSFSQPQQWELPSE